MEKGLEEAHFLQKHSLESALDLERGLDRESVFLLRSHFLQKHSPDTPEDALDLERGLDRDSHFLLRPHFLQKHSAERSVLEMALSLSQYLQPENCFLLVTLRLHLLHCLHLQKL